MLCLMELLSEDVEIALKELKSIFLEYKKKMRRVKKSNPH